MPLLIFNVVKSELSNVLSHTQHVSEGNREIRENKDDWIKSNFSYILLLLQGFFLNGSISLDSGGHFNRESTLHQERTKIIRLNQISASFYFFCQGDF